MVQVFASPESLSDAAAALFVLCAQHAVSTNDRFSVALAGGNTTRLMYSLLAHSPYRDQVPWEKVHVFWGDERFVHPDDPRSNYRAVRESLLDHVPIPPKNVHPILCDHSPVDSATVYQELLQRYFENSSPRFDLVLLGLGADGHTASLFPGNPDLSNSPAWVAATQRIGDSLARITLTPRILNQAATIVFLVAGEDKAAVLKRVIAEPALNEKLPAQLIRPSSGDIFWMVDEAAARLLRT